MSQRLNQHAADWPRCDGCHQPLPRDLAEARGLVRLAPEPPPVLCKAYRIEKQFRVKRRNGGFA